ncbi:von Willebrand factor D and EGF domain-containing protein [Exaiptasia diaphana]|nr:von Willebrand factor D and EGF domain-containing protein [Exaiptasia diaphana]
MYVHARSWVCGHPSSAVTCNCGAAIREGADIIIFDICNANLVQTPRLLKTEIRSEGGLAPGTHIIRTVQGITVTHDVLLPSGNRVKVERYEWGISIYVKAMSPKDNTIFGLCGNFNGRQDDEFHQGGDKQKYGDPVSFGKSWRFGTAFTPLGAIFRIAHYKFSAK